jgi:hypothetical protein
MTATLQNKAALTVQGMTTTALIDAFEQLGHGEFESVVMMWIMDELCERDEASFLRFADSGDESPRGYFA